MGVKRQHYVPQVYLKNWETKVSSKKEPKKYFQGIYHYEKRHLEMGDGRNKDSVLWEPRLYNINYELSFIIPSCPEIEKDYIAQVEDKLASRGVNAFFKGQILSGKELLSRHFFELDQWEFRYIKPPKDLAKKKATLSEIKAIQSYVLEHALDRVIENKWQSLLNTFINLVEETVPLDWEIGIRNIDEVVVEEVVAMIIFLMCRNPEFDYLEILPKILDTFREVAQDIPNIDSHLQIQKDAVWLKQLYNALFGVKEGYFHVLTQAAQNDLQMILFRTMDDQGSFITSDNPAFIHKLRVETTNSNSIICPLTPQYLLMIGKGDKNSLSNIIFRKADNMQIKHFNRMICSHSKRSIVSDKKYLGYIL